MPGPRNKYLAAEDEQQKLERQYTAQLEFMRGTLTHLAAAAKGLDENLDRELALLKEKIRGASGAQVVEQMQRVQQAVKQFERDREQLNGTAAGQFIALVDTLRELNLPVDIRGRLDKYRKNLKPRLDSWRIYPDLVGELAELQKLALAAAAEEPKNFWQRLKGGKRLASAHSAETSQKDKSTSDAQAQAPPTVDPAVPAAGVNIESAEAEDSYQRVAKRITRTLRNLVASIDTTALIRHKVDIVQARLERGMDWYALAVTLEDIRDILMQRYLVADKEFSDYLKKVNEDLNSIRARLGLAVEADDAKSGAARVLSAAVSEHVSSMRSSIDRSVDLAGLKREVKLHIDDIHRALENYRRDEDGRASLSDQLRGLVERVQSIESEARKTQQLLEQERHKATHDSLTSLPNREAYTQRVWHEFQRYQRYQHPLTLAVCDIDRFKSINDKYGHQAGDRVLKLFAKILSTRLREVDFIARYGGEEFVILLPETDADQALVVLDKIRKVVSAAAFRFRDEPLKISASFGIATFGAEDEVEAVFTRADKALYEAKNQGRNRCVLA